MRIGGSAAPPRLQVVRMLVSCCLEEIDLKIVVAGMLSDDHAAIDLQPGSIIIGPRSFQLADIRRQPPRPARWRSARRCAAGDLAFVRRVVVDRRFMIAVPRVSVSSALIADQGRAWGRRTPAACVRREARISDQFGLALRIFCTTTADALVDVDDDSRSASSSSPESSGATAPWRRHRELEASARMVSIRMPSCSSAAAATSMASFSSDGDTRSANVAFASRNRRSRIHALVTLVPSVPASGESLTRNVIAASADRSAGRGAASRFGAQMVCATVASEARDRHDIAREGLIERKALQSAERQHLGDAALLDSLPVRFEHLRGLIRLHGA